MGVTLWGSHYQLQPTKNRILENETGLLATGPQEANYQVWVAPAAHGAAAIQAQGGEIGINIQSTSIAANLVSKFDLGTIVLGADLPAPVQPFASGKKAKYSFAAKIPRSGQTGRGVSQVCGVLQPARQGSQPELLVRHGDVQFAGLVLSKRPGVSSA